MNILYIGEETRNWIILLANEIALSDNDITVVVKKYDEYDDGNRVEPIDRVTVVEVENEAFFHPFMIDDFIEKKNMKKFDVVYGSHIIACVPVASIGKIYNIPYGMQVLDVPMDLMKQEPTRMNNWKLYRSVLKDVSSMTFITKKARDDWYLFTGKKYPDSNIITYAAIIDDKYEKTGIEVKGNYVVSACRLTPIKNINMITRALTLIDRPIKQVVIGRDRGDKLTIENIAKENNIEVIFKNSIPEDEKAQLIRDSLCVVYPQQTEYIGGLNPWEGMMIGKPVLCTDYDILKDLYENGVTYFDKTSAEALADEITKIYDNEYDKDRLREISDFAYYKACYENMAVRILDVFDKMVKK